MKPFRKTSQGTSTSSPPPTITVKQPEVYTPTPYVYTQSAEEKAQQEKLKAEQEAAKQAQEEATQKNARMERISACVKYMESKIQTAGSDRDYAISQCYNIQ